MDGVLLIDKPSGPTSHDVVARLRRTTGERSIGHTGTLDPLATGLMALVCGRATRLSSYLMNGDKTYEAIIRLGQATDTDDAAGRPLGPPTATLPDDRAIAEALDRFRGTFDQLPPTHSAKRVAGEKAYELARKQQPVSLKPAAVTVRALDLLERRDGRLAVRVSATAGFYVRALARDLGASLGCGAHLEALRRTASGVFDVRQALPLEDAERLGADVSAHLISPAAALPDLPAVEVTIVGFRRAIHGNYLEPSHLVPPGATDAPWRANAGPSRVRVLGPEGQLVAVAEARGGALHPVVVLG